MKRGLIGMTRRQIIEAAREEFSRKGGCVEGVVKVRGDSHYYRQLGAKAAAVRRAKLEAAVRRKAELACFPKGDVVSVSNAAMKDAGDKAVAKWRAVQERRRKGRLTPYMKAITGIDQKATRKLIEGLSKS